MEKRKPRIYLDLHTETGFCTADYHVEGWDEPGYEGGEPVGEMMFEGDSCEECMTRMLQSGRFGVLPANVQWYYYLDALHRNFPQEEDKRAKIFARPEILKSAVLQFEGVKERFLKRIGEELADRVKELENQISEIKDSVAGSQIQDAFYQSLQEHAANRIS